MACDECKGTAMYERCAQLRAQRNAAVAALRLYHGDGGNGALLRETAVYLRDLASRVELKHSAACKAIELAKEK